jgi:hypothetical protein
MNHFARLLRRALAQPRHLPETLFDPFEQVAPWPLESPVSQRAPAGDAPQGTPVHAVPPEVPPLLPPTAARQPAPPAAADIPNAPRTAAPAGPADRPALPAPPERAPAAVTQPAPEPSPLARADAFMRSLGVTVPERAAAPPQAHPPLPAAPAAAAPMPTATVPARLPEEAGAAPAPRAAARMHPPEPAHTEPRAALPRPSRGAAPEVAAGWAARSSEPAAAPAHRAAPVFMQAPVQTTVVVRADGPGAMQELAQGVALTRFGIGQA